MTDGVEPPKKTPRGAAERVRISHAETRVTLRIALAFIAAAAVVALFGADRWLPLHLFLAGGIVLAISGVSLMLTVTWSAAPAPANRWVIAQRTAITVGAAGVGAGRELDWPTWIVGSAGCLFVAGLVLLAVLLVNTVRRGVERRFDVPVAYYVAAMVAGIAAVSVGIVMAIDEVTTDLRSAHVTLNLLGLVGLVIGGTLPFFSATVGRVKIARRARPKRLTALLGWQALALSATTIGLAGGTRAVAVIGLSAYAVGVAVVMWMLPRPTRRQFDWAGPRQIALWAGTAWWIAAVVASTVEVARDESIIFYGRWLLVLVIAGYAQILWGSLAYLLPMLRGGGHERLSAGFAATRSWVGLAAANLAGLAFALSAEFAGAVFVGVWVVDAAVRAARLTMPVGSRPQ